MELYAAVSFIPEDENARRGLSEQILRSTRQNQSQSGRNTVYKEG